MDYFIEINNTKYIIKKLHEISLTEYNDVYKIIQDQDYTGLLYMLSDIPSELARYIPTEEIKKIEWNNIINEPISTHKLKKSYFDKKLIDLNLVSVGRFIDLDYILTSDIKNKLETIMALLLLEDNCDPDEDIILLMKQKDKLLKQIIKNMSVSEITAPINYLTSWRKNKLKSYENLFSIEEEEDDGDYEEGEEPEEVETDDTGWAGICYDNAKEFYYINNKNIFDAPLTSFLNWLSWKKRSIDLENERLKKQTSGF